MNARIKPIHVRHIHPNVILPTGKKLAGLQTERACQQMIIVYEAQIAKIEAQIEHEPPRSAGTSPEEILSWKTRALGAADHKRQILAEIRVALELAREKHFQISVKFQQVLDEVRLRVPADVYEEVLKAVKAKLEEPLGEAA